MSGWLPVSRQLFRTVGEPGPALTGFCQALVRGRGGLEPFWDSEAPQISIRCAQTEKQGRFPGVWRLRTPMTGVLTGLTLGRSAAIVRRRIGLEIVRLELKEEVPCN